MDLNSLLLEVIELYRSNPQGARIRTELDDELPKINADPTRIRQLLNNLIKNALEAIDGIDVGQVEISTLCLAESGCRIIELAISDNGAGFTDELLENAFEPYVTNKARGTGLGLAIVKKIVEEHGGMISAENQAEGGAIIRVQLPVPSQATAITNQQDDA